LFDKEADTEVLDAVDVDALVADTEVLDPEVADAEVVIAKAVDAETADEVVELFVLGTAWNAVPIPHKEDATFLDKKGRRPQCNGRMPKNRNTFNAQIVIAIFLADRWSLMQQGRMIEQIDIR
jgi:hypothetical protein